MNHLIKYKCWHHSDITVCEEVKNMIRSPSIINVQSLMLLMNQHRTCTHFKYNMIWSATFAYFCGCCFVVVLFVLLCCMVVVVLFFSAGLLSWSSLDWLQWTKGPSTRKHSFVKTHTFCIVLADCPHGSWKRTFLKTVSGWRNPKTQPSCFHVDGESAYFPKRWRHCPTPRPLASDLWTPRRLITTTMAAYIFVFVLQKILSLSCNLLAL